MRTIAFFNNKGGVGKTTLTYHLAHMLPRVGFPTLAVDLDPQANLTSAFFDVERLESIWTEGGDTLLTSVNPILEGTGDIAPAKPLAAARNLWTLPGDLGLSRFEDKLSEAWPRGFMNDQAALRTTSAFHRLIRQGGDAVGAAVALLDVGPNLGAINRAALLAADFLVVPLGADLFSLQGLKNLGPTVRQWRQNWRRMRENVSSPLDLPSGEMEPAGYIVLQHAVRLDRPVRAYARWLDRIPSVYAESVLGESADGANGEHALGTVRNYRSLMPMAQDARKPIFDLTPADGAIGSHAQLVRVCEGEFRELAVRIAQVCELDREQSSAA